MPGTNLTRNEAVRREAVVSHLAYELTLDLASGPSTFRSLTTVRFDARPGESTFLDLTAETVASVTFNGRPLDPERVYRDHRLELTDLRGHNEVTVDALCRYSRTGEGLHRSVDPSDGNVYLYTQFEVPDARRVYAVFDQPDLKATFDYTVLAPASWTVISNTPAASVTDTDRLTEAGTLGERAPEKVRRWVFARTPVMSSYLTAFAAGPYASWHTTYANADGRTVPFGIFCRQALKDALAKDVDYLFDITRKGFDFYTAIWHVPYPYPKYDQVFVPEYNAGAMENIGMVTLRDQYVFSSKVTTAMANRRVETVLHELAHMWFGDYVTMRWWNDLWLNESFAEFMSTLATAEATDWKDDWATFCSGEKSWALREDQLPTTHPIVAPINDLNDTYVNFDGITYAKGASVLKQLVAYVGRESFFRGIYNYLVKHAYGNATLEDLLAELGAVSGRDLKSWSRVWLEQAGITTISTEVATDDSGAITHLALVQTAPKEHPVLRPHRLAIGFYDLAGDEGGGDGAVTRTSRVEVDVAGERTEVPQLTGRKRPGLILVNDDDLTYAKLRLDDDSLAFAEEHLAAFRDPLARAVVWLSFWDMTRDAQYPAERFIGLSLRALATERQGTTFRSALAQVFTTAHHYVASARRDPMLALVAQSLWQQAEGARAGSDQQFQLLQAYLGYGSDPDFPTRAHGLLDGQTAFDGLEVDNNLRWAILTALARQGLADNSAIDAELARRDTTENREFSYGARASVPTPQAKAWAWNQALHNGELTNMQLERVAFGFSATPRPDLQQPYVKRYFDAAGWIWTHKSFQMAETLLLGLYPAYADPAALVEAGDAWLAANRGAERALRRIVIKNVEGSRRTLAVCRYNEGL